VRGRGGMCGSCGGFKKGSCRALLESVVGGCQEEWGGGKQQAAPPVRSEGGWLVSRSFGVASVVVASRPSSCHPVAVRRGLQ
jgi:hypothetical protein